MFITVRILEGLLDTLEKHVYAKNLSQILEYKIRY